MLPASQSVKICILCSILPRILLWTSSKLEDPDHILNSDTVKKFVNFKLWFQRKQDDIQKDTVHSKKLTSYKFNIEQHLQKQHPHTSVRFRRLLVVTHISTFFRLLWPCIMNVGWRERDQQDATNLMFIIKLLSQHVSGIIKPIIRRALHIPSHTRHHRSGKLPTSSNTPT